MGAIQGRRNRRPPATERLNAAAIPKSHRAYACMRLPSSRKPRRARHSLLTGGTEVGGRDARQHFEDAPHGRALANQEPVPPLVAQGNVRPLVEAREPQRRIADSKLGSGLEISGLDPAIPEERAV